MSSLTIIERDELDRLEGVIERHLGGFCQVGLSLMAIRDRRLYKSTHRSFEDYCRQRWDFDKSYAYRLIKSAEVVQELPIGDALPRNESQARELAKADNPVEAWQECVETAPRDDDGEPVITAQHVRETVNKSRMEVEPERPFAALAEMPDDMAEAFESFKLSILRHKLSGWSAIEKEDVQHALQTLIGLCEPTE
jgi:hypothetical protein